MKLGACIQKFKKIINYYATRKIATEFSKDWSSLCLLSFFKSPWCYYKYVLPSARLFVNKITRTIYVINYDDVMYKILTRFMMEQNFKLIIRGLKIISSEKNIIYQMYDDSCFKYQKIFSDVNSPLTLSNTPYWILDKQNVYVIYE